MSHGVGNYFQRELSLELSSKHFSLNVDEATNNAGNKIVNVMVQYWSDEQQKCVLRLLGSREVNLATASNIFMAISDILNVRQLNWSQVISVMMDNCSVMRGVKNGVEALIKKVNPFLLNVSGDTVHMINNAASDFFTPIESSFKIQKFLSCLFYDIEDSPKQRYLFRSIQEAWRIFQIRVKFLKSHK